MSTSGDIISTSEDVEYMGDIMMHVGDTMSTSGDTMSTLGDIMSTSEDTMIYVGEQVDKSLSISIENPTSPDVLMVFPQCTHDIP